MRAILTVLLLSAILAHAQLGPGDHTLTITGRPEGIRTFLVHAPQKYASAAAGSVPVIFAWHGYTEGCQRFKYTGLDAVSEGEGFIVVWPCGTGISPSFNAGVCCGNNRNDDVEFARLMVQKLLQNFNKVNASRIFTTGFSNGGMMSEQLACKSSHIFAAAASIGGTMTINPGGVIAFDECDKFYANTTRRIPILLIHGTSDAIVIWTGNPVYRFPAIPANHQRWAMRNKCTGAPVQTFKKGPFSNSVYQNCPAGPVELVAHEGGPHTWPNTTDFSSAHYVWKFFSAF